MHPAAAYQLMTTRMYVYVSARRKSTTSGVGERRFVQAGTQPALKQRLMDVLRPLPVTDTRITSVD